MTNTNTAAVTVTLEDEQAFQERLSDLPDLLVAVRDLVSTLESAFDTFPDVASEARNVADAVSTADSVETVTDLDANLNEALQGAQRLRPLIAKALKTAKGDDEVVVGALDDAKDMLTSVIREIKALMAD